jgi:hypothetical protein
MKRAPSLASAAEATTKHSIVHSVKNAPFNLIGSALGLLANLKETRKIKGARQVEATRITTVGKE